MFQTTTKLVSTTSWSGAHFMVHMLVFGWWWLPLYWTTTFSALSPPELGNIRTLYGIDGVVSRALCFDPGYHSIHNIHICLLGITWVEQFETLETTTKQSGWLRQADFNFILSEHSEGGYTAFVIVGAHIPGAENLSWFQHNCPKWENPCITPMYGWLNQKERLHLFQDDSCIHMPSHGKRIFFPKVQPFWENYHHPIPTIKVWWHRPVALLEWPRERLGVVVGNPKKYADLRSQINMRDSVNVNLFYLLAGYSMWDCLNHP